MKNMNFEQLNKELNNGTISGINDIPVDKVELEGIYNWGFTTISYCDGIGLDPIITFYDWKRQIILSLSTCHRYSLVNGQLHVQIMFVDEVASEYSVDLNNGAPIHVEDIIALLSYKNTIAMFVNINGNVCIYRRTEGLPLEIFSDTEIDVNDYLDSGYRLLSKDYYQDNVDLFNHLIVAKK